MKKINQIRRDARYLFRLCLVNGSLDESRERISEVSQVLDLALEPATAAALAA